MEYFVIVQDKSKSFSLPNTRISPYFMYNENGNNISDWQGKLLIGYETVNKTLTAVHVYIHSKCLDND